MANDRLREALLRNGLSLDHVARRPASTRRPSSAGSPGTHPVPAPPQRHRVDGPRDRELPLARRGSRGTQGRDRRVRGRQGLPAPQQHPRGPVGPAAQRRHRAHRGPGHSRHCSWSSGRCSRRSCARRPRTARRSGCCSATRPAARHPARPRRSIGKGTVAARIRNALAFYRPLVDVPEHRDPAPQDHALQLDLPLRRRDDRQHPRLRLPRRPRPALHLRRLSAGDLFETYSESFETVWTSAKRTTF